MIIEVIFLIPLNQNVVLIVHFASLSVLLILQFYSYFLGLRISIKVNYSIFYLFFHLKKLYNFLIVNILITQFL